MWFRLLLLALLTGTAFGQPTATSSPIAQRVLRVTGAPSTGCTLLGHVGRIRVQVDLGSSSSPLYICANTGVGTYGWVLSGAGGSGAPTDATYITQTANGSLSAEQALGALVTGCLGSATTTGIVSARTIAGTANQISIASGDCSGNPTISIPTNPTLPGTTTGTFSGPLTGNSSTATALAANGGNCTAGNYPLGVDTLGAVEGCTAAGSGVLLKQSKTIPAADIMLLFTVPYEIIAAPGANKIIEVETISCGLDWNSVAFTGGGNLQFQYQAGSPVALITVGTMGTTLVTGTADSHQRIKVTNTTLAAASSFENIAITLANATGAFATGNSELKCELTYWILDTF